MSVLPASVAQIQLGLTSEELTTGAPTEVGGLKSKAYPAFIHTFDVEIQVPYAPLLARNVAVAVCEWPEGPESEETDTLLGQHDFLERFSMLQRNFQPFYDCHLKLR